MSTKKIQILNGASIVPKSDWNQTDDTKADYIKNKPTLGTISTKDTIEKTDLSSDVQATLDKADTAIQSIDGLATETYVDNKVAGVVNSAPETLDTLNELAAALGNDANFATTVTTQIGNKVDKIDGKGLSTNDYTDDEKTKLSGIENGANKTVVDTALSASSTNPIQNKVVNTAINNCAKLSDNNVFNGDNTFSNPITVSTPTDDAHAATKKYVDESKSGSLHYKGEVDSLPSTANIGDIYKLSADYRKGQYVVPTTNVYSIEAHPEIEGMSKISAGGAVEALLTYVREGAVYGSYGDFPNHHYYYNGQRYSIPFMVSYEDAMIVYTDTVFESLLLSGEPIVCDLTYVSQMPKVLANCFVGVNGTKGMCFIWDGSAWKSLDADFATLADKSVTTEKIADKAVTGAKLADYSVSSNKINGSIPVGKGGTGKGSWYAYRMIYPSSTSAFSQLSFPTAESVLCQKTSGAPYWKFLSEIGGSGGGGGYKKIGYTDDCDYKVSASSGGKAAFDAAIAAASDGDTIIVMMGTYSYSGSNKDLSVNKNLNFVGIGTPTITFNVSTTLDDVVYGEYGYIESASSHTTSWDGFAFKGNFTVGCADGADFSAQSTANAINCMFYGSTLQFSGAYTNCVISTSSSISGGCYYGNGSSFFDCSITCESMDNAVGSDDFKNCDIRISKSSYSSDYINYGGASYDGCNLYLLGSGTVSLGNVHGGTYTMQNTTVYCSADLTFTDEFYMERTNCTKVTLTSF